MTSLKQKRKRSVGTFADSREIVLGKLNAIFRDFVKIISIKNGLPESLATEVGGKIFTFGSYRLGVHGRGRTTDNRK